MSHLRRLAEAATRGPWHVDAMDDGGDFSGGKNYHVVSGGQSVAMCPEDLFGGVEPGDGSPWQSKRNAEYMAAASPDVLIALMDRAEKAEEELRAEKRAAMTDRSDSQRLLAERDAALTILARVDAALAWGCPMADGIAISANSDGTITITTTVGDKSARVRVTAEYAQSLAARLLMAAAPAMLRTDEKGK